VCELLAVSTSQPARLTFSLRTLASHGSATGLAHDGWGVAFYQGSDVALFREPVGQDRERLFARLARRAGHHHLGHGVGGVTAQLDVIKPSDDLEFGLFCGGAPERLARPVSFRH
jgi:Glutamine amidotransferases class-II